MLRDPNLIPLSHQHQHALALCVRIDRALKAGDRETKPWQAEVQAIFSNEIRYHFEAEEKILFPAASRFSELADLVDELRIEHGSLRGYASRAEQGELTVADLQIFTESLSAHIRKEERQLFERCQELFPAPEMDELGAAMDAYFRGSGMPGAACAVRSAGKQP